LHDGSRIRSGSRPRDGRITYDLEEIIAKTNDVYIRELHNPQRDTINFTDVYPCVAHRAIVAVTHHLAAHPAETEWPQVDDGAGHIDSIDQRPARLQHRFIGPEALQPRGREPLGVDPRVDGDDEDTCAADGIGRQRQLDLAVANLSAVNELPIQTSLTSGCGRKSKFVALLRFVAC
jgi:hypothetical protein